MVKGRSGQKMINDLLMQLETLVSAMSRQDRLLEIVVTLTFGLAMFCLLLRKEGTDE
jgi:hypothetical protein